MKLTAALATTAVMLVFSSSALTTNGYGFNNTDPMAFNRGGHPGVGTSLRPLPHFKRTRASSFLRLRSAKQTLKAALRTNWTYWRKGFKRSIACKRKKRYRFRCRASWRRIVTESHESLVIYGRARVNVRRDEPGVCRLKGWAHYGPRPDPNGHSSTIRLDYTGHC